MIAIFGGAKKYFTIQIYYNKNKSENLNLRLLSILCILSILTLYIKIEHFYRKLKQQKYTHSWYLIIA